MRSVILASILGIVALAAILPFATPAQAGSWGVADAEQRLEDHGEIHRLTFQPGETHHVTLAWNATLEAEGERAWILLPRLPWNATTLGNASGPTLRFDLVVNERSVYQRTFEVGEGDVLIESPFGWPHPDEIAAPRGLSTLPFLARNGTNEIRYEVQIAYNATGKGNSTVEVGPLRVGLWPTDVPRREWGATPPREDLGPEAAGAAVDAKATPGAAPIALAGVAAAVALLRDRRRVR